MCFWMGTNFLTMGQTALLKTPSVRKYVGIWDPPKPVPGQEPESLIETFNKLTHNVQGQAITEEETIRKHNTTVDSFGYTVECHSVFGGCGWRSFRCDVASSLLFSTSISRNTRGPKSVAVTSAQSSVENPKIATSTTLSRSNL
jgi:hypothetical protein